jgi:sulfate adenylyltransferase
MSELHLNLTQYLEFEKLALGAFAPVAGFMNEDEFRAVTETMRLPGGAPFPLPVVLDIDDDTAGRIAGRSSVALVFRGEHVGDLRPESIFGCDKDETSIALFGTRSLEHPGVRFFKAGGDRFVGGPVTLKRRAVTDLSPYELTPRETRAIFAARGWNTVTGFQTRNVPHRAHEYLQRVALEVTDGLFIQPLVGRRKIGDYAPEAILAGYRTLIEDFFPKDRVVLGILTTAMRYAGPREAVFHAIIRRNYGCTHFVVGRDHAGVGDFYGKYDAHRMTERFDGELGIAILRLSGPFYCSACDGIATERSCGHGAGESASVVHIAGTDMRAMLLGGMEPDRHLMRPEVIAAARRVPLFVEREDA